MRALLSVVDAASDDAGWRMDSPDWGTWDFESLPRAGDILDLSRDGRNHLLIVEKVVHFIVQHPRPRTETPYLQRKEPSIRIIAKRWSKAESDRPLPRQWQVRT